MSQTNSKLSVNEQDVAIEKVIQKLERVSVKTFDDVDELLKPFGFELISSELLKHLMEVESQFLKQQGA